MVLSRAFRGAGRWGVAAGLAVAALGVALVCLVGPVAPGPAGAGPRAQVEDPEPAGGPAIDPGGPVPVEDGGAPRTGPDPTGRDVPPTGQRLLDSAIWLWLVALLGGAIGLVGWRWWRSGAAGDDPPLVPLERSGPDQAGPPARPGPAGPAGPSQ